MKGGYPRFICSVWKAGGCCR